MQTSFDRLYKYIEFELQQAINSRRPTSTASVRHRQTLIKPNFIGNADPSHWHGKGDRDIWRRRARASEMEKEGERVASISSTWRLWPRQMVFVLSVVAKRFEPIRGHVLEIKTKINK